MGVSCIRIVKYTVLKLLLFQLTENFVLVKSAVLLLFVLFFILTIAKHMK